MNNTPEQQAAVDAVHLWDRKYKSPTLINNPKNISAMTDYVINKMNNVWTVENLCAAEHALAAAGLLDYASNLQDAEPELNLPYPDEPLLKNIRTLDDINALTTQQVRRFIAPRDPVTRLPSDLEAKFNARVSFIQRNKLRARPKEAQVPVAQQPQTLEAFAAGIGEAAILADLKREISEFRANNFSRTEKVRASLKKTFNTCVERKMPATKIVAVIQAEMKQYEPADTTAGGRYRPGQF